MRQQNPMRAISGGIFLIGLAFAFIIGGHFFLPLLFVALAVCSLFGTLSTFRPGAIYGGLQSFIWLLGLAFLFLTDWWWPGILFIIGISAIVGALARPIMTGIFGAGVMGAATMANWQPPQQYQPPQPQYQQPYQPYQQGYQPPAQQQPPESYQEGGRQYQYPQQPEPQYEQPQAQYPQEQPPMQQQ